MIITSDKGIDFICTEIGTNHRLNYFAAEYEHMELEELCSSTLLQDWLDPGLLDTAALTDYRNQFLCNTPFQHLYIDNLLNADRLEAIIDELSEQEFEYKEADLFHLAQTPDFDELDSDLLIAFKDMLRSEEFISLMEYITDTPLSSDIDCLGNIYQDTDFLLCHDDKLITRKIAYILYLTELTEEEGGALHLFDTDANNQPGTIVKKIYPKTNRLTFFKVTRQSYHEVGEILQEDTFRVSISGWFNND